MARCRADNSSSHSARGRADNGGHRPKGQETANNQSAEGSQANSGIDGARCTGSSPDLAAGCTERDEFSHDHFENDFQMDSEGSDEEDHLDDFDHLFYQIRQGRTFSRG